MLEILVQQDTFKKRNQAKVGGNYFLSTGGDKLRRMDELEFEGIDLFADIMCLLFLCLMVQGMIEEWWD